MSRLGSFSFFLIVLLVVVMPWLNAAADIASRPILYLFATVSIAAGLADVLWSRRPVRIPGSAWVLFAGGCLIALQLIPTGISIPSKSLELRRELTDLDVGTISLDPSQTRTQLANLVVCVGVFLASCNTLWSSTRLRLLCYCLLTNGAALSVFAIIQKLTWNGKLYWFIEVPRGHSTFGSFIYHNVAASYLSICFAAGIYLAITSLLSARKRGLGVTTNRLVEGILLTIVIVGLLTSLSRGVVLSLTVALVPVAWMLGKRGLIRGRMRWSIPIFVAAAALLVWFGLAQTVTERLSTLMSEQVLSNEVRLQHWAIAAQAARDFWRCGCGVGAYGDLVATYGQATVNKFEHAHNQYLEAAVTAGVLGLVTLLGLVAVISRESISLVSSRDNLRWVSGLTCLLLLFTQVIHAFVDYCSFLPGINLTLAAVFGSLFTSSQRREKTVDLPANRLSVGIVLLLPLLCWAIWDSTTAGRLAWTLSKLPWRQELVDLPIAPIDELAGELENALQWRPDDAQAQEALGILRLTQYRHEAKAVLAKASGFPEADPQLWNWTSPQVLHHRSHSLLNSGRASVLEELRTQELVVTYLVPAMDAFKQSRNACPLLPGVHLRLEELGFIDGPEAMNGEHNRRALELAQADAALLFECGKRDFGAQRYDRAYDSWHRSLALSGYYLGEITRLSQQFLTPQAFVERVLPDDLPLLMAVLEDSDDTNREAMIDRIEGMLANTEEADMTAEQSHALAKIAWTNGNARKAARHLQRALRLSPERVDWRFDLARYYAALEMWTDAKREAVACTRASDDKRFHEFLESLPRKIQP